MSTDEDREVMERTRRARSACRAAVDHSERLGGHGMDTLAPDHLAKNLIVDLRLWCVSEGYDFEEVLAQVQAEEA